MVLEDSSVFVASVMRFCPDSPDIAPASVTFFTTSGGPFFSEDFELESDDEEEDRSDFAFCDVTFSFCDFIVFFTFSSKDDFRELERLGEDLRLFGRLLTSLSVACDKSGETRDLGETLLLFEVIFCFDDCFPLRGGRELSPLDCEDFVFGCSFLLVDELSDEMKLPSKLLISVSVFWENSSGESLEFSLDRFEEPSMLSGLGGFFESFSLFSEEFGSELPSLDFGLSEACFL